MIGVREGRCEQTHLLSHTLLSQLKVDFLVKICLDSSCVNACPFCICHSVTLVLLSN